MAVKIHRIRGLLTADELELLNRMLRDLGLAVNGLENASGAIVTPPSSGGTNDHHKLINLTNFDDHPQYLYLPGRAGGQTVDGSTGLDSSINISQPNHVDSVTGKYGAMYIRSKEATLQVPLIIEKNDASSEDMVTGYRTQVAPGSFGNRVWGITKEGNYYIQNIGYLATGSDSGIALQANSGDDLIEAFKDVDSFTDLLFTATLGLGWNDTVGAVITGKNRNSKLKRLGISILDGVIIQNDLRVNLIPPAGLLHIRNASGAGTIPLISDGIAGQTGNLQEWRVAGTLKSAIDKDGKFTGGVTPAAGSITPSMIADRTRRIYISTNQMVQSVGLTMTRTVAGTYPNQYEGWQFQDNPSSKPQGLLHQMMIPEDYSSNLEVFMWYKLISVGLGLDTGLVFRVNYKFLANGDSITGAANLITTTVAHPGDYTNIHRVSLGVISTGIATGKFLRLIIDRDTTDGNDDTTDTLLYLMTEIAYTADS